MFFEREYLQCVSHKSEHACMVASSVLNNAHLANSIQGLRGPCTGNIGSKTRVCTDSDVPRMDLRIGDMCDGVTELPKEAMTLPLTVSDSSSVA